jgi:hypothetical protein
MTTCRLGIFVAALCASLPLHAVAQSDLQRLAREAPFVFSGTVAVSGSGRMPMLPQSPTNVVVRIDRLLAAPSPFGNFSGREVVVALLKAGSPKIGEAAVFFTSGWAYGETLALREVGHVDVPQDLSKFGEQLAAARRSNDDDDLRVLLARAELVIAGRLVHIEPLPRGVSEHDPAFQHAYVHVDAVLKGGVRKGSTVSFLFAGSMDIVWRRSPKPKEGDTAIWIVARHERENVDGNELTALDPRDVQPTPRRDAIAGLLAAMQPHEDSNR